MRLLVLVLWVLGRGCGREAWQVRLLVLLVGLGNKWGRGARKVRLLMLWGLML